MIKFMNTLLERAVDPRQFPQWGEYLKKIGWTVERVQGLQIFIKKMPVIGQAMVKIQHPIGPIPFAKIDKLAEKYNAFATIIEPHNYKYDEESYKKAGFHPSKLFFSNTATVKIDLTQSEDALLKSFSENARRNIKKALSNKLSLKTFFYKDDKDNKALKQFYTLQKNLQKLKKFYAPPYEEQLKKIQAFRDSSYICFAYEDLQRTKDKGENGKNILSFDQAKRVEKFEREKFSTSASSAGLRSNNKLGESFYNAQTVFGSRRDKPIATVWYAYHKNVVFYVQTGIMQRGYDLLANYLLVWEGMKTAKKLGIKVFDFESIYDPRFPGESRRWKKYSEFKRRFHGELIEYPRPWIKFYKNWFKYLYMMSNVFNK